MQLLLLPKINIHRETASESEIILMLNGRKKNENKETLCCYSLNELVISTNRNAREIEKSNEYVLLFKENTRWRLYQRRNTLLNCFSHLIHLSKALLFERNIFLKKFLNIHVVL